MNESKFLRQIGDKFHLQETKEQTKREKMAEVFVNFSNFKVHQIDSVRKNGSDVSVVAEFRKRKNVTGNGVKSAFQFEVIDELNPVLAKQLKDYKNRNKLNACSRKIGRGNLNSLINSRDFIFVINEESTLGNMPNLAEKIIMRGIQDWKLQTFHSLYGQLYKRSEVNFKGPREKIEKITSNEIKINTFTPLHSLKYKCGSLLNFKKTNSEAEIEKITTKTFNNNNPSLSLISYQEQQFDKLSLTFEKIKNLLKIDSKCQKLSKFYNSRRSLNPVINFNMCIKQKSSILDYDNFCKIYSYYLCPIIPKFIYNSIDYAQDSSKVSDLERDLNLIYNDSSINIISIEVEKIQIRSLSRYTHNCNLNRAKNSFAKLNNSLSNFNRQLGLLNEVNLDFSNLKIRAHRRTGNSVLKLSNSRDPQAIFVKHNNNRKTHMTAPLREGTKRKFSEFNNTSGKKTEETDDSAYFTIFINYKKISKDFSQTFIENLMQNLKMKNISNLTFLPSSTSEEKKSNKNKLKSQENQGRESFASISIFEMFNMIDIILNFDEACLLLNSEFFADEYDSKPFETVFEAIKRNYMSYEKIYIIFFQAEGNSGKFQQLTTYIDKHQQSGIISGVTLIKVSLMQELTDFIIKKAALIEKEKMGKHFALHSGINSVSSNIELSIFMQQTFPLITIYELNILFNVSLTDNFCSFLDFLKRKYEGKMKIDDQIIKKIFNK